MGLWVVCVYARSRMGVCWCACVPAQTWRDTWPEWSAPCRGEFLWLFVASDVSEAVLVRADLSLRDNNAPVPAVGRKGHTMSRNATQSCRSECKATGTAAAATHDKRTQSQSSLHALHTAWHFSALPDAVTRDVWNALSHEDAVCAVALRAVPTATSS